jgi:hypothetical protein
MFTVRARATNTFFIHALYVVYKCINVEMFTVRVRATKCHPEIPYDEKKIES